MPTRVLEVVSGRKYCVNCMQTTPVFSITCFISFLPLLFEQNYRVSGFKLHCRQEVRFQTISFKGFTTARRIQQSAQFIRTYWNDLLANISPDRNPFQKCRSVLGEHSHILSKINEGKKTDVMIAGTVACEQTRPYIRETEPNLNKYVFSQIILCLDWWIMWSTARQSQRGPHLTKLRTHLARCP